MTKRQLRSSWMFVDNVGQDAPHLFVHFRYAWLPRGLFDKEVLCHRLGPKQAMFIEKPSGHLEEGEG